MIDALKLLSLAISPAEHVDTFPAELSCDGNDHWDKGEALMRRLTKVGQISAQFQPTGVFAYYDIAIVRSADFKGTCS